MISEASTLQPPWELLVFPGDAVVATQWCEAFPIVDLYTGISPSRDIADGHNKSPDASIVPHCFSAE